MKKQYNAADWVFWQRRMKRINELKKKAREMKKND